MSRISRSTLILLAARRSARGGFLLDRQRGIEQMRNAPLPFKDVVGKRKYLAACTLKDATLNLAMLEGEAWSRASDKVMELAYQFESMPNEPAVDPPYAEYRFERS